MFNVKKLVMLVFKQNIYKYLRLKYFAIKNENIVLII